MITRGTLIYPTWSMYCIHSLMMNWNRIIVIISVYVKAPYSVIAVLYFITCHMFNRTLHHAKNFLIRMNDIVISTVEVILKARNDLFHKL